MSGASAHIRLDTCVRIVDSANDARVGVIDEILRAPADIGQGKRVGLRFLSPGVRAVVRVDVAVVMGTDGEGQLYVLLGDGVHGRGFRRR